MLLVMTRNNEDVAKRSMTQHKIIYYAILLSRFEVYVMSSNGAMRLNIYKDGDTLQPVLRPIAVTCIVESPEVT